MAMRSCLTCSLVVVLLSILLLLRNAFAENIPITHTVPDRCKSGSHRQAGGPFAIYVFCDDALGANIAIFLTQMGVPQQGQYTLTNRFWQSNEWGADITSFAWLPGGKNLILATSSIYGTGKVYLLQLEPQSATTLYSADEGVCIIRLKSVRTHKIVLAVQDCETNRAKETVIQY